MPPKSTAKKAAPKAKAKTGPRGMAKPIDPGLVMTDLAKKQWKLGPVLGQGGFGYIYLGTSATNGGSGTVNTTNADYVIKVEPHNNGPLFVELAFYIRVAKAELVKSWIKDKKMSHLGVPVYIGSGSFEHDKEKYRFMVIDRFGTDVEKLYLENGGIFPETTVYSLGLRIVDALEYLHDKEYVHADIKASNLMMGYKKSDTSKVWLLDYGLAYKYMPGGTHVIYKEDPKRKHDGTIEYTSRDAHKGLAPSRRGDMEILGYCMLQWLCRKLPWEDKLTDKDYVAKQKEKYMGNLKEFMSKCHNDENSLDVIKNYLELVNKIGYDEKPKYDEIRKLFKDALKHCGVSDDGKTICLPVPGKQKSGVKKSRTALKDLPTENSPVKKRAKSPVRKRATEETKQNDETSVKQLTPMKKTKAANTVRNSPRKVVPVNVSPVKKVQASCGLRRSPRRSVVLTSDESAGEEDEPVVTKKVKTTSIDNDSVGISNGSAISDRVVMVDGVARTVHRRVRKRNVSTRDFAQSP